MANPTILQQQALQYATPATIPTIQKSQYLANALEQLQSTAGQNLRTPTALWSNLAADALLQFARHKSDQQLAGGIQSGMASQNNAANAEMGLPASPAPSTPAAPPPSGVLGGLGSALGGIGHAIAGAPAMLGHFLGGGSTQTAPGAPAPATIPPADPGNAAPVPAAAPQGPPIQSAPLPPPQSAPAAAPQIDPQVDAIVRTVYGEARGEPPVGQQAVAAVALNRAKATGLSPSAVVSAPGQFAGYGAGQNLSPSDPAYQRILRNITPALKGYDPTGGADHFYAPQGMPGGKPPTWAVGQPATVIGNHHFLTLGQPQPQAVVQNPGAFEVAGPVPPSAAAPLPSGFGAAPPPAMPQAGGGIPTGPGATPQEKALFQQLMANPPTMAQGRALAAQIAQRQAAPIELNKDEYWGPNGQAQSVHQLQDVPGGSPNAYTQRDPVTGEIKVTANPAFGPVGAGQAMDQTGHISQLPVTQRQTFRIPGAPGSYVTGPDGTPQKVADDAYGVKELGADLTELQKTPQYLALDNATNMYNAAVQAAARPGGISDVELRDFAARQFSGGVARQFNVDALNNAQGVWANLKQIAPELISGQHMSPQARQQVLQAMHDDAVQAQNAFNGIAKSKAAFAAAQGADLTPFIAPLSRPLPGVPNISSIPGGMPGVNPANANGVSSSPSGLFPGLDPGPASSVVHRPGPAGGQGAGGQGAGGRLSPEQAKALPSGAHFVGLDGVPRVRQ